MAEPQAPNNGEEIKDEAPDVASRAKQAADGSASASLPIISQKFEKMREGAVSELDKDLIAILERLALADQQTILDSQAASQEERQASPEPPSSDPSATTEALHASSSAAAAATEIDRILPKTDSSEELELFLMTLWELVFLAARAVPYNHTGQNQFVAVLQSLRSRAKTTVTLWGADMRLWRDLPLLESFLREVWIDPEVASEGGEVDDDYASEWINLNVFTARLMQKGLIRFSVLAVLEIRNALEEELPTAGLVRDYKLSVASQWILISGTLIFKDAFKGDVLDETELRATAPGQLYINSGGKHGLCMDRWRFWQKRLGEVGSTGVGEKVGLMAKQAARHMEDIMEQDGRAIARRLGTGNEAYGSKSGIDPSGT